MYPVTPPAGLVAFYYVREFRNLPDWIRALLIRVRRPLAARRLSLMREELIAEIEHGREVYQQSRGAGAGSNPQGTE